jgi:DUF1680 family protein
MRQMKSLAAVGIAAAYLLVTLASTSRAADELVDTRQSEHAAVRPVGLDEVRWTDGFWADRFATCRDRSIPAMWDIMKGTKYKPYYQNFLIAAGQAEGDFHGAPFNDGDFYKFLEGACAALAVTRDPQLEQIIEQSIDAIGRAQRDDGYIHTPVLIAQLHGDADAKPFQDRVNFEMYNMGHLMTAACIHYRVTGRDNFLTIARRAADFLYETFRNPTAEMARNSVCPSHYMGVVELYRTTREPRYLELAKTFLDMRNLVKDGGDDNQDRVPFVDQREAVGHAVRANYLYAGAADLFLENGDRSLWTPLESIWKDVAHKKVYITGGCGALYDGASPDGSPDQSQITRVHQAYGRNYQLPNVTAYNETCATIGSMLWNWRMFLATGDARYVDTMETALYNAVLSGVSLEGSDYFYANPLRQVEPLPTRLRWSRTRVPYVTSFCCPPNVVRTIAEVNGYAYSKTDDAIWINLYSGSTLSTELGGQPLKLTQQTDYPWDGHVRVTIDKCPDSAFALRLRIPGWADTARIRVNGVPASIKPVPGSYVEMSRRWRSGDIVDLDVPMPARLMESHPLVEENRNQIAIQRGPIVYCLESLDLPEGSRVGDVFMPADAKLAARHMPDLLQGVGVVEADVVVRPLGNWSGMLYRPLQSAQEKKIRVRFIPYYAWANRGKSEMTVWLPVE